MIIEERILESISEDILTEIFVLKKDKRWIEESLTVMNLIIKKRQKREETLTEKIKKSPDKRHTQTRGSLTETF